jgi:ribose-phosphate pyrophosphokinase
MRDDYTIFTGTANPQLAASVASELGIRPEAYAVERFPDGEILVRIDEPVRGCKVFILQPTAPPVNEHLAELLILTIDLHAPQIEGSFISRWTA